MTKVIPLTVRALFLITFVGLGLYLSACTSVANEERNSSALTGGRKSLGHRNSVWLAWSSSQASPLSEGAADVWQFASGFVAPVPNKNVPGRIDHWVITSGHFLGPILRGPSKEDPAYLHICVSDTVRKHTCFSHGTTIIRLKKNNGQLIFSPEYLSTYRADVSEREQALRTNGIFDLALLNISDVVARESITTFDMNIVLAKKFSLQESVLDGSMEGEEVDFLREPMGARGLALNTIDPSHTIELGHKISIFHEEKLTDLGAANIALCENSQEISAQSTVQAGDSGGVGYIRRGDSTELTLSTTDEYCYERAFIYKDVLDALMRRRLLEIAKTYSATSANVLLTAESFAKYAQSKGVAKYLPGCDQRQRYAVYKTLEAGWPVMGRLLKMEQAKDTLVHEERYQRLDASAYGGRWLRDMTGISVGK